MQVEMALDISALERDLLYDARLASRYQAWLAS